eukprot:1233801-Prymnesium_polylepis.1
MKGRRVCVWVTRLTEPGGGAEWPERDARVSGHSSFHDVARPRTGYWTIKNDCFLAALHGGAASPRPSFGTYCAASRALAESQVRCCTTLRHALAVP